MTREEAIKYGIEWLKDEYLDAKDRAFIKIALEVLEQEPKWIPVSERLPDIHNYCMKYLVTDCHRHIHTSLFTESNGKSRWSRSDVIAWMPLPKPYKVERIENEK